MLQLSKIKQSRDEWREKAKERGRELWEMRKVHKYYKDRVARLVEENKALKAKSEEPKVEYYSKKKFYNGTKS